MDNFVFVATPFPKQVREHFLQDAGVGWMMEHGLVSTNEHGDLDPRATLQLYRARRIETSWSLGRLDGDIDAALIARLPTSKSDPGAQVISFEAARANVMGRAELDLLDRFRTLEAIVVGARRVYGEGDISVEFIGEQLRKSDLADAQQHKLLLSTRNVFYRSFAPVDRLFWYSAAINPFEVREAAYDAPRTQCVSYLYSPTFIEGWFRMFLPPAEIRTLLHAFPAIYHELRYTSLHSYMVEFKDYYHRHLVKELDRKLADAHGTGDLAAADPSRMEGEWASARWSWSMGCWPPARWRSLGSHSSRPGYRCSTRRSARRATVTR